MGGLNMGKQTISTAFNRKWLDSRVKSANTTKKEAWLGFFAGPCSVSIIYCMLDPVLYRRFGDFRRCIGHDAFLLQNCRCDYKYCYGKNY